MVDARNELPGPAAAGLGEKELLDTITRHYLDSSDFNGISTRQLARECASTPLDVARALEPMVRRGTVFVLTSDSGNPAILRNPPPSVERQVEGMLAERTEEWWTVVAYPSASHLQAVDRSTFADRPYTLRLALGEPQLNFQAFHLRVLEFYRNDPRYLINATDMEGSIAFRPEHTQNRVHPADDTYLESFGFCFDEQPRRAVAVFLCYLSGLSPEHQHLWRASALDESGFMLHNDYRNKAAGRWASRDMSCFEAMLSILATINAMCGAAGWQPLFKRAFSKDARPSEFTFLLRPTAKTFDSFVQVLDKLLGDNLNPHFFPAHISRVDAGGRQKNTITLLKEWIASSVELSDESLIHVLVDTLRRVRAMRSKPAHEVQVDQWNDKFMDQQRDLMKEVLDALECLRAILATHPLAGTVHLPQSMRDASIYYV